MAQTNSTMILRTAFAVRAMAAAEGWSEEKELEEVAARLGNRFDASKVKSRVNQLRKRLESELESGKLTEAQREGLAATLEKMPSYAAGKRGKKFDVDALNSIAEEFGA